MRPVHYVAGTHAGDPDWIFNPNHPFQVLARAFGLRPAIDERTGRPFSWSTRLGGIWPFNHRVWFREAEDLVNVARDHAARGYDIDLFGHSHGGQLIIIATALLAAYGIRVRTITTVSTPRRRDVPAHAARENCDYWQHTYDPRRDWIATLPRRRTLGQIGDGALSTDRTFTDVRGVVNIPIPAGHSRLLETPEGLRYLRSENIFGPIAHRP